MTSKQLGGASDKEFIAETFEEIAEMSKQHAMKMCQQGDRGYLEAMEKMKNLMETDPQAAQKWFEEKRQEFNNLPEL